MLRLPALLAALAVCALALAQDGGITEQETDFEKKLRITRPLRLQLFKGEISANPTDKAHLEAIDVAAKEATYPLHWQGRSFRPGKLEPSQLIKDTVEDVEGKLRLLSRSKEPSIVAPLQAQYPKALAARTRDVILSGPPIAAVNAGRILQLITRRLPGQSTKDWSDDLLPRLADGTGEVLLATTADLIATDPKKVNDGTRVLLLRVAHDLLALPPQRPALFKPETADKAVAAASDVVTRQATFPKATPRGEVEGFKMLRAEALRVVARASAPANGKARPAMLLARVAANDVTVNPPPRVEEFSEAAIGLCRLIASSAKVADFHADYAAQQVARAVAQFGIEANKNFDAKAITKARPWRVDAARLLDAVEMLKTSKDSYVLEVVRNARPVLIDIEAGRNTQAANLATWANGDTKPANASLFKGGDPSEVTPRAPKEGE